jgi:hypothetical protein
MSKKGATREIALSHKCTSLPALKVGHGEKKSTSQQCDHRYGSSLVPEIVLHATAEPDAIASALIGTKALYGVKAPPFHFTIHVDFHKNTSRAIARLTILPPHSSEIHWFVTVL